MKIYKLTRSQFLPIELKTAWDFFSSPKNLSVITPDWMNFKIVSISGEDKMFEGQIITYKVNILPLVRVRWVTEITNIQEPHNFTDKQRSGPYALWRHTHNLKEVVGGVEMDDEIEYALPLGFIGRMANSLFVGREVNRIFDFRRELLDSYFNNKS